MRYEPALQFGTWLQRYKRFFVDVRTDSGETLTLHCPNTGAMTGCGTPGCRVAFQMSDNPARKLRGTLELVQIDDVWIGVHPARANKLVREAIDAGVIHELRDWHVVRAEVRVPNSLSRFDFELAGPEGKCLVEVKSVSWVQADGTALFPDAVSTRALLHVEELTALARCAESVGLMFCVQHAGALRCSPAAVIQPEYAAALRNAREAGVVLCAYATVISSDAIALTRCLPIVL